jgi:hypothetical protein
VSKHCWDSLDNYPDFPSCSFVSFVVPMSLV